MTVSQSREGFTLIELLCVFAIVALLVCALLAAITRGYSRAKKLKGEIGNGQTNIIEMQKPGGLLSAE
jgi:prepilin-type N-terminal cleavage/methylation domain-containing protein